MSWSSSFIAALESEALTYQVVVDGSAVALSTAPIHLAGRPYLAGAPKVAGMGLRLRDWQASSGSMTFALTLPRDDVASFRGEWELGDRAQVFARTAGGVTERIWLGSVQDVIVSPDGTGALILDNVVPLATAPRPAGWGSAARFTDAGETKPAMWFQAIAVNAAMSSSYQMATKGYVQTPSLTFNPTTSGQPLALNSVSGYVLGYSFISGADEGAVMVQGAGAQPSVPYLLTYTGISSPNLTGCKLPGPAKLTPPHYSLSPSDPVRHVSWVDGHAFDIIRGVLQSSSTGTNGAFDVLPSNWGVAFPDADIDQPDIAQWYSLLQEPATPRYSLAVMERMADGIAPLWEWAAAIGVWPVMRHGKLSLRAAADPYDSGLSSLIAMHVTDEHIRAVGAQRNRHPDCPQIARNILVATSAFDTGFVSSIDGSPSDISTSSAAGTPRGWPRVYSHTLPLAAHIFHDPGDQRKDAGRRLAPWWQRFPADAVVSLSGEALKLVPGDVVQVTSDIITGPDGAPLSSTPALVVPSAQDWGERSVEVGLVFLRR